MAVSITLGGTSQNINATNGSPNITLASTAGWVVGATIQGGGFAAGTKIVSFVANTSAVLSNNYTGTTGVVSVIASSNTGTITITLSASADTASPQNLVTAGFGLLRGSKTIEIFGSTKLILQLATGSTWNDTEWVYELGSGSSLRWNETYGCGTWRSGYILNGSTYVKAKGATINYTNFDNSTGAGGRNIFYNSGAPSGYVAGTTHPTIHWNDVAWVEFGGSNAAAILATAYGKFDAGRIVMDYAGDGAGANAGIGGSFGAIESLLLYRCIGGVSTGIDTTKVVTVGKFEYFSLPATGTEVRMAFPNNVPFYGFAPLTYQVPATNTYICQNTTNTEILRDYTFPTGFDIPTRSKNYSANTRTYERKVNMPIKDSSNVALANTTVYIKSGSEILKNAVLTGDLNEYIQAVYLSWIGRSPATGSYILPISFKDTEAQTAQFRKNGYVSQTVSYDVTEGNYFQPIFLLLDVAYGSVTPTQAAALTGIALDYTNKLITGSSAKNLDELYAFGQYSQALTANSAQSDFQASNGGTYGLTNAWKLYWTAGALTMGTYNKTFNSSTQWKINGSTSSLTLNKKDVVWTPAAYADQLFFENGATFNLSNSSTLTVNPTVNFGYVSPPMFGQNVKSNISDSTVIYNLNASHSGNIFGADINSTISGVPSVTVNYSNFVLTVNGVSTTFADVGCFWTQASTVNNWTINGTSASSVRLQVGVANQQLNGLTMAGTLLGSNLAANGRVMYMNNFTYTGSQSVLPNSQGGYPLWYFVDPVRSDDALFRWGAGSTPTGTTGFNAVLGFRPTITIDKPGYTPKVRITPSTLSSRYPVKIFSTTALSDVDLSNFYRDSVFMSTSDGFLPFVDSLDSKTTLNTIDWTLSFRQAGYNDQNITFLASAAKKGNITYTASGATDINYVNSSTGLADSTLININTTTKNISAVSGTISWSPQRMYNALKNWWATYASDTDFLANTGAGILDLGDYNTDSTVTFIQGIAGDALTRVVTTGTVSSTTNTVPVTDSTGSKSRLLVNGLSSGMVVKIVDTATGTTVASTTSTGTSASFEYTLALGTTSQNVTLYVEKAVGQANGYNLYTNNLILTADTQTTTAIMSIDTFYGRSSGQADRANVSVTWNSTTGAPTITLSGDADVKSVYDVVLESHATTTNITYNRPTTGDGFTYQFNNAIFTGTGKMTGSKQFFTTGGVSINYDLILNYLNTLNFLPNSWIKVIKTSDNSVLSPFALNTLGKLELNMGTGVDYKVFVKKDGYKPLVVELNSGTGQALTLNQTAQAYYNGATDISTLIPLLDVTNVSGILSIVSVGEMRATSLEVCAIIDHLQKDEDYADVALYAETGDIWEIISQYQNTPDPTYIKIERESSLTNTELTIWDTYFTTGSTNVPDEDITPIQASTGLWVMSNRSAVGEVTVKNEQAVAISQNASEYVWSKILENGKTANKNVSQSNNFDAITSIEVQKTN